MKSKLIKTILLVMFGLMLMPHFAHADITTGLQIWWKLDDGSGTTAADSSGNGNSGTLGTGGGLPVWVTPGKVGGGGALSFSSGAIEYVNSNSVFNIAHPTESAWFKVSSAPASKGCLVTMMNGQPSGTFDHDIEMTTSGAVSWYIYDGSPEVVTSSATYADGKWHHVAATADGSNMYLYIDGAQVASGAAGNAYTGYSVNNFFAGSDTGSVGGNNCTKMTMKLDDVRLYNRALSATDVAELYAYPAPYSDITSNLVGWWKFEDKSGTAAIDSSGNSNTGTFQGGSNSSWTSKAKVGLGAYYDVLGTGGSGGYVNTTNTVAGSHQDQTYAAWIYPTSLTGEIGQNVFISTDDGQAEITSSGYLSFVDRTGSTHTYTGTTIQTNKWAHVVVTCADSTGQVTLYLNGVQVSQDTSNAVACYNNLSSKVIVGGYEPSLGSLGWTGYIDDARYYQRVLGPNDVRALYQLANTWKVGVAQNTITPSGDLVGLWTFDGKNMPWSSSTVGAALDTSGNGLDAALIGMNRSTASVVGKEGQALSLDGSNDYAVTSDSLPSMTAMTVAAWVKPNGTQVPYFRIAETHFASGFELGADSNGTQYSLTINNSAFEIGGTVTPGAWQYVVGTYDGTRSRLYVNGVQVDSHSNPSLSIPGGPLYIGTYDQSPSSGYLFKGAMDDLRIYNRALSDTEIQRLYSAGKTSALVKAPLAPPCMATYNNRGGIGDRRPNFGRASISVTSSGSGIPAMQGGGGAVDSAWVDGDNTTNSHGFFQTVSLNGSQWIEFDMGSGNSALITEAKYYQQDSTPQGTWKWQGSNDNSTWIDIGSSFALGGVPTEKITTLSGNKIKYRYYRILGLSGNTDPTPWLYEMEFKICGI